MIDPRLDIIGRRLEPVRRIVAVSSAKGGVGKSVCAALCALALGEAGYRTGLLDLDFQGASAHLLLGVEPRFPEEDSGIRPLRVRNTVDFMSFTAFSGEHPVPLRGSDSTEAMLELLAITIWDRLDFLLIDMPPGIGDEILDALRFLQRPEFLVVATASRVVLRVVERLLAILSELKAPIVGVVENMVRSRTLDGRTPDGRTPPSVQSLAARYNTALLGSVPYEPEIDTILADDNPLQSSIGRSVRAIGEQISLRGR
jgi:ATP-binding protein involved in chromosome partitioning